VTLTPGELRTATFEHTRRGYDPTSVDELVAAVADRLEAVEAELTDTMAVLEESRETEANLRATMLAMSQAREQILDAARGEADQLAVQAEREATRTVERAEGEAAEIVMEARRQALDVIAGARRDADYVLETARTAAGPLTEKVAQLRAVIRRTENLMRGLASGTLGELAQAHLMLDEAPRNELTEMQIVFSEEDHHRDDAPELADTSVLPAAVDRLLTHLREIG